MSVRLAGFALAALAGSLGARAADVPHPYAVVVEETACPVVRFAAAELTNGLSRTLGVSVPVVTEPQTSGTSIILGRNRWSRAEGLDPLPLARDGFLQLAKGDRIYLLGVDDERRDPRGCYTGSAPLMGFERGTLNAVYDFLERSADARFFFPGELGTLFAHKTRLDVAEGLQKREPVFTERYFGWWNTAKDGWYDKSVTVQKATAQHWLRLRFGSSRRQCCHGQRAFDLVNRYGKAHPEWFCLTKEGKRNLRDTRGEPSWLNSKFCYTSPIREAIYEDVKAFLSGQPASSRGLRAWGASFVKDRAESYVDIMPEDGFNECFCPNCQAAYDKSHRAYATDLIWKMTAEIASRLQRDGVAGGVSQMAYYPYDDVPSFALPTNVQVMVAVPGPWAAPDAKRHAAQLARLRDWTDKLGHKVWLWTYPGKYDGKMKGIPEVTPRAYAKFWSEAAPHVIGGYCDNDTDQFMYEVLNLYVFAKLAWDPQTDVDALLADWNARLFGAAKDEMAAVYDLLESKWVNEISRGRVIESALGPVTVAPSSGQLWGDIYTGKAVAELRRRFDAAARLVAPGSPEARRVALMRAELFDRLARQSEEADPAVELARRRREKPVSLIPDGSCDSKEGWEKSYAWGTTEVDADVKVSGRASLRLTSDTVPHRERNVQADACVPVCLSASKTYRLSYFIRLKDVAPYDPANGAGLCLWLAGGHYIKHPLPLMKGTSDWIHQSHVFTPPVDAPKGKLQFRLEDSLGTMWIDDVLLEEVGGSALPDAAHDRGGTSFDIGKLSAEKFPAGAYPNVGPSCLVKDWTGVHTNGDTQVVALPHGRGGKFRIVARTKVRPLDPEVPMRDTAIMIRIGTKNPWFRETPKRGSYVWNGFLKRGRDWFVATKVFDVRPGETHALVMLRCEQARIELKDVVLCEEVAQPPAPDAPAGTDPLVIETQFCSTVGPTFEVSEGQVGEIGFAFRRPKDEKCNFRKGKFRLELPAGIDYVDATFAAAGTAKTVRKPDGSSVTEFSPGDCPIGPSAPWWLARYVLLAATGGVGTCGDGRLVYAYDDGKRAFECSSMKIRFSIGPAIRVAQPKRYGMGGWQLGAYEFKDPKSVERLSQFHRDCGQTWIIPSAKTSYPELPTWRACGFRTVTPQSGVWCRNGYELAAEKVPETDRFVPVGTDHGRFEHSYRIAVCPLAVKERTPYVRDVVLKRIADNVQGVDGMWSNWEPFMFNGGGCACERCGKAFAAFLGKDWAEVAKTWPACAFKKGAYEKKGREFRSRCHADVVRTIDACVRGVTGKDSVGFLPGIHFGQMTSSWRTHHPMPEASPEHYAADIPWINIWGPYVAWRSNHPYQTERARHVAHCACARDLRDQIAADYPPERRPKILTAPQGTCGDYFTEPEAFEMNFDAYFFNGFAGCCPWVFPVGADARWWRAFANAAARAAKYEDVVSDGTAADGKVSLETVPEYAKPVAQLMRYLHNWKKVPQVFTVSYDFGKSRFVAVLNCWRKGEAFFTLRLTGLTAGEYAVVSEDGVLWADSRRKTTWTAEELAKGVFLSVGCCRTRVFEIVPAGDRPLTEPKSVMTAERQRAAYAERKADLARLAAQDAALAEDDLAGISWCD